MADDNSGESFFTRSKRTYGYDTAKGTSNKKRVIMIFIGILILIALIVIAILATGGNGSVEKNLPVKLINTPTPTKTPIPTPTISITPTKAPASYDTQFKLDRANLTVDVQNGSGTKGAADKGAKTLKDLGYKIGNTGNADNFNYDKTVIEIKSTKKNYLDLLKKDLSADYTIGSTSATLSGTSADAIVIIGAK